MEQAKRVCPEHKTEMNRTASYEEELPRHLWCRDSSDQSNFFDIAETSV